MRRRQFMESFESFWFLDLTNLENAQHSLRDRSVCLDDSLVTVPDPGEQGLELLNKEKKPSIIPHSVHLTGLGWNGDETRILSFWDVWPKCIHESTPQYKILCQKQWCSQRAANDWGDRRRK